MKLDKYLMKKAREKGRKLNPDHPIEGLRQYKQDITDTLRYSQIERDPREVVKYDLKEGRFLDPVWKLGGPLIKVAACNFVYGLITSIAGELTNNGVLQNHGEIFLQGASYIGLTGIANCFNCYSIQKFRRKNHGIPNIRKLHKPAKIRKGIVEKNHVALGGNLTSLDFLLDKNGLGGEVSGIVRKVERVKNDPVPITLITLDSVGGNGLSVTLPYFGSVNEEVMGKQVDITTVKRGITSFSKLKQTIKGEGFDYSVKRNYDDVYSALAE